MPDTLTRQQPPFDPEARHPATAFGLAERPALATQVELRITPSGLELTTGEGQRRTLALDELSVSYGGAQGDQLVLESGDPAKGGVVVYIRDRAAIQAVRKAAPSTLGTRLAQAEATRRRSRRVSAAVWVGLLLGVAALAWGLVRGLGVAADAVAARFPVKWEVELGQQAVKATLAGEQVVHDAVVNRAAETLVARLEEALPAHSYQFHVQVVQRDEVNAFALPGGEIVVYTGLLAEAESPAEAAGVLAHEMHHVLQRHGLKRLTRSLGLVTVVQALFGDAAGAMAVIRDRASGLATLKYDRTQETEADVHAVATVARAGFDPQAMVSFFQRLSASENKLTEALTFASTHPASRDRMKRLNRAIEQLPQPKLRPLPLDWNEVRRRCGAEGAKPFSKE